jgi:tetratricopeptide (TPR) repeat protein
MRYSLLAVFLIISSAALAQPTDEYVALMSSAEKDYYDKQYQASAEKYKKASDIASKSNGENSREFINATWSLVYVYQALNNPGAVDANLKKVTSLVFKTFPTDTSVIDLVERTADYFKQAALYDKAFFHYRSALTMRKQSQTAKGNNFYLDAVYVRDYLFNQGKLDSVHYYFQEIIHALPTTDNKFASTLRDWANFFINKEATNYLDQIEKRCNEYLLAKEQKNEKDNWYAETWITYGKIFKWRGQVERALNCFTQARKAIAPIIDKSLNQNLYCLNTIVDTYFTTKKYDVNTAAIVKEFETENEKIASTDPQNYIANVTLLQNYYIQRKQHQEAVACIEKNMAATEKLLGNKSEQYRLLSLVYRQELENSGNKEKLKSLPKVDDKEREQLYMKAFDLEGVEKDLKLLSTYMSKGDYLNAIGLFEKRSSMFMKYFENQKDHETLLQTLHVMANCYQEIGNFPKAYEMLLLGESIALNNIPASSHTPALAVMHVAGFQKLMGAHDQAENRYLKSLNMLDAARTKANEKENDKLYYTGVSQLADLYTKMRYFKDAEDLYYKVLNFTIDTEGEKSVAVLLIKLDLAHLYRAMESYPLAEQLYMEVEPEIKKIYGGRPEYYDFLSGLAALYNQRGKYALAEPVYLQCKAYFLKNRGNKSERYIGMCRDLALVYHHQGSYEKASQQYKEIKDLLLYQVDNFFPSLTENERTRFYSSTYRSFDTYNSFATHAAKTLPSEVNAMYDLQLVSKGMLFKAFNKMRDNISQSQNDSIKILYQRWIDTKNDLAKIYQMSDQEKKSSGIDERGMEVLAESLEKKLSKQSEIFSKIISRRPTWNTIQQKLKPGEAAIEIVRIWSAMPAFKFDYIGKGMTYDTLGEGGFARVFAIHSDRNPAAKAGVSEGDLIVKIRGVSTIVKTRDELQEMMSGENVEFIFKKKSTQKEYTIRLSPDSVFSRYYDRHAKYAALILTADNPKQVQLTVIENGDQLESRYLTYYQNVMRTRSEDKFSYQVFWKDIWEKTGKAKKIYFSPDGVYNSININTFRNPESGKYVIDETEVVQVSNTSDILLAPGTSTAKEGVLLGFPDYYRKQLATPPKAERDSSYFLLALDTTQRFMDGTTITDLPGTKGEVNAIAEIMQSMKLTVRKYLEGEATEEHLKSIRSAKVLHIATHGFFVKEIGKTTTQDGRSFTGILDRKMIENPLLRSGLLLAGSGKTIAGEKDSGKEDGILTAYEAMNLDLDQTELVVMSACETGLGQLQSGEGVYGLQRAFRAAGAKSVMMSMWKVDDQATQQLMSEFYRQWLKEGEKQPSFRNAQLKLREKFTHPYYWGAFILVGH